MKSIKKILSAGLLMLAVMLDSCKKETDVFITPGDEPAVMDQEERRFQDVVADIPNMEISLDSLYLSNGATIKEFITNNPEFEAELTNTLRGARTSTTQNSDLSKQALFSQVLLFVNAYKLTHITESIEWDKQKKTFKNDPYIDKDHFTVEGKRVGTPKQPLGLGYSYGQRDWRIRATPPKGGCQDEMIYGLDCSGFVYNVFKMSGFQIPDSSANGMHSLTYWQDVLESRDGLDGIKVDHLKDGSGRHEFPTSSYANMDLKAGDIIFWKKTRNSRYYHTGIILQHGKGKKLGLFQANGIDGPQSTNLSPMKDCGKTTKGDCESNYLCPGRGVRVKDLDQIYWMQTDGFFSVIRVQAFAGNAGNPRFNLQFDNHQKVDLDLHVRTPNGFEIFYGAKYDSATEGQLDLDCLCNDCSNGPNENIFWPLNKPFPRGKYRFWIKYFGTCNLGDAPSNYQIMLVNDLIPAVLFTATGTLNSNDPSPTWEYDTETGLITKLQ